MRALALVTGMMLLPALTAASETRCRWGELAPFDPPVTAGRAAQDAAVGDNSLAVIYAVPANVTPNPAVLARIKQATRDILTWYQCATGGRTWTLAFPETVRTYSALQTREYYKATGDWWGSLIPEMGNAGQPVWAYRTVTAVWAHGAGFWAGAAQGCVTDCGVALLGVELFPEFNNVAYSGGTCPGGTGVAAFPCTPEGAFAHELGHTLGLPHPTDVPATQTDANHSIMQTHWNYPTYATGAEAPWGFLTLELQTLHASAFMKTGVPSITQTYDCPIVNLPVTGAPPTAGFTVAGTGTARTLAFTNTSTGATESYWTFGDGAVSGVTSPTHTYAAKGSFSARLRSYAGNGMMATQSTATVVDVVQSRSTPARLSLGISGANPFTRTTFFSLALAQAGTVRMTVISASGGRVATLADGWRPAGTWQIGWSGRDDGGRRVPAGVYFARAVTSTGVASVRIVHVE